MQMLTVQFRYDVSEEQFARDNNADAARMISEIPGLLWKYWLHSAERKECIGVYHFKDRASAEAYMNSPIIKEFLPGYTIDAVKLYELMVENSAICRAPGVSGAD